MKQRYLEEINRVLDLSKRNFFHDIEEVIRGQFNDLSDEEIGELKQYIEEFVKCCTDYGDILANKFKVPFLLRDDKSKQEIEKYIAECRKKYPGIEERHITGIFSTVCWLTNR